MKATARFDRKRDANEKAQNLLEQVSRVQLAKRDFLALNAVIGGAFSPNPALQQALRSAARVKRTEC